MSRHVNLMARATRRDPDRVEEWISELRPDTPVAVYCSYGFDVGRSVTKTLIERGFDARCVRGGIAASHACVRAQTDGVIAIVSRIACMPRPETRVHELSGRGVFRACPGRSGQAKVRW